MIIWLDFFNTISQFNNILIDFDRDIWSYISLGYFKQITKAGEIGSSTMPNEKLKELTRGRAVNEESIRKFITSLELPEEAKDQLLKLTPHTYVGAAAALALAVDEAVHLGH